MKHSKQRSRLPKFVQRLGFLRILGLLFAFLLGINLLFACIAQTAEPVTLSFVVPKDEAESWRPLIKQFEAKNKGIRIDLANLRQQNPVNPEDTDQLKAIYINAFKEKSSSYDLIYTDIIWVPEFAAAGLLINLSDDFSEVGLKKEFLHNEVDNGYYDGKLYRIPFRTDVGVLYYRQDLLKEVGDPPLETFEDLIKISQALQKKNLTSHYLWQGQQTEALVAMFVEVLEGYGGFWIKDHKVGLDQSKAIQAVEFLRDTIYKHRISPESLTTYNEELTRSQFLNGEAAFMRNWPYVWTDANAPGSPVLGKIAITPMVHAEGQKSSACKGGWGFGIAETTKHKEKALQAIKFFTSAAVQRQFTLAFGSVPSRRKLFFEPKIVSRYSHYPTLLNVIDKSNWVARPRIPQYAKASSILQKHLSAALKPDDKNGYINPREAMIAAARETQQLLNLKDK